MEVTFLAADQPLCKTYYVTHVAPYPFVSNFSSITYHPNTIQELYVLICDHSEKGHCLLKGNTSRTLNNESRSGSTNASFPTKYAVLDIDHCPIHIETPEQFIKECLPPEFHDISYVWQWSNSARIRKQHLAGHFFFALNEEIQPSLLKLLLTHYNLSNATLRNEIKLSANAMTLKYPLDITCAQNDKLIYIAPPQLKGIRDPFPPLERITLILKQLHEVKLNKDIQFGALENGILTKTNELRVEAGMPRKKHKFATKFDTQYLANTEKAIFRGPYIKGRGFVYGNLNNGDSFGYYHPEENPYFLYNFKGEPVVRIQDIDPDYWQTLQQPTQGKILHFAFRDRKSDTFYTIIYDQTADSYTADVVSNLQKAESFLRLNHADVPDDLPIWDVIFEPNKDYTIDFDNKKLNSYQKTEYIKKATPSSTYPHKFGELLLHVVGDDLAIRDDLLNWLAFIIQKREKTHTAFIFHGRTGTGKGVLFTKVLQPILGTAHCPMILLEELDREFNEWLETAIIVMVDEAHLNENAQKTVRRVNKIKSLITEPTFITKKKFVNAHQVQSYASYVFASNQHDAILLDEQDRRFKVPPRQERSINYTKQDILELEKELQAITNYLMHHTCNETAVRHAALTPAKQLLVEASRYGLDQFIHILKNGDLASLLEYQDVITNQSTAVYADRFKIATTAWIIHANTPTNIPINDLRLVYSYMIGEDISAIRFGRYLKQKGFESSVDWDTGKPIRTVMITWQLPEDIQQCLLQQPGHIQSSPNTKNAHIH